TIFVSGVSGRIGDISVTLNGLSHPDIEDVDILLVAPDGARMILWCDAGTGHVASTITLSDQALTLAPSGPLTATRYRPTNYNPFGGPDDMFPAPAPGILADDSPA